MNAVEIPGQVIVPAAFIAAAFLFLGVVAVLILIASAIATWWRGRQHDVGPDPLKLLEDLDAHLDGFALEDPEIEAGLARLFKELGPPPAHDQGGESA
ncbi:MAG: hypothetical protein HOY76_36330 [Streptomyces sp.]|nr:hypothetical protein [Streptomyces sp.]